MSDRPEPKTGSFRPPPIAAGEWKAWLLLASIFIAPGGLAGGGALYVGNRLDRQHAATMENTAAIQELKLSMEGGKVVETRLRVVEEKTADHETRIRALEQRR